MSRTRELLRLFNRASFGGLDLAGARGPAPLSSRGAGAPPAGPARARGRGPAARCAAHAPHPAEPLRGQGRASQRQQAPAGVLRAEASVLSAGSVCHAATVAVLAVVSVLCDGTGRWPCAHQLVGGGAGPAGVPDLQPWLLASVVGRGRRPCSCPHRVLGHARGRVSLCKRQW